MEVLSGLCVCESFEFVYSDGSTAPAGQRSSTTRDLIDCPMEVTCHDAVGDPCPCNATGSGCAEETDENQEVEILMDVFTPCDDLNEAVRQKLKELIEQEGNQEKVFRIRKNH